MAFGKDTHGGIDPKLISQFKSIFDEMSIIFDRFDISEITVLNEKYKELDDNIKIVSKIIDSYWNVNIDLVISDFQTEIERKNKVQMQIPNVPTYQIRFALEEGSWIVLLRNEFPVLLRNQLSRLITLEDTIFKTGKGIDDDCAYYLIELELISNQWIKPLMRYWVSEHDFSKDLDFVPRAIAALYSSSVERGNEIFTGAKRLFHLKMKTLDRVNQITTSSNWALNAQDIYLTLAEEFVSDKNSPDTMNLFVTLCALQKEIIRSTSTKSDENLRKDEFDYKIIDKIGWKDLDVHDDEGLEFFSDALLLVLYDLPFDEPAVAAQKLLDIFLNEIGISKKIADQYRSLLQNELEAKTSEIIDPEILEKTIVEFIEEFLPSLFVQIKQKIMLDKENPLLTKFEVLKQSDQWENFEAQVLRIKRIDTREIAISSFKKVIKSNYDLLIAQSLDPDVVVDLIASNFVSTLKLQNFNQIEYKEEIKSFIENNQSDEGSLSVLDQLLIDNLFNKLINFII